ncbi:MAG: substrate-binding domain-containing protein [Trueperaceae bacterium]|nr:substrate-binding domain-containing protein [Trueperaceae bacterium]
MKHISRFVLTLVSLALVAGAFAQDDTPTIGLSLSTLNNPFFVAVNDGAEQEADLYGYDLVVTDAQNDLNKQTSDVQDLITRGVDVLLINPVDSAGIVPAVRQANEAGIPVFAIDRGIDVSGKAQVVAQIASDNEFGGRLQARYLVQQIGDSGNVIYLAGIPGTSAARDREAGFTDELSQIAPDITIVANQPAGFDRGEGLTVTQNILQTNSDVDAVVAANDSMALGAVQALEQANVTREGGESVVVIGFDAIDSALDAISEGRMAATVAQQPALMGQLGVSAARNLVLNPLMYDTLDNGQFLPVAVQIISAEDVE